MRSVAQKRKSVKKPLRGKALLRATWNWIVNHPESHNQFQERNVCGSARCFCGWIWVLSGVGGVSENYCIDRHLLCEMAGITESNNYALYNPRNGLARLHRLVVKFTGSSRGLLPISKQSRAVG